MHIALRLRCRRLSRAGIVLFTTLTACSALEGLMGPAPDPAADAYCLEQDRLRAAKGEDARPEGQCQRDLFKIRDTSPTTYACKLTCADRGLETLERMNKCSADCSYFRGGAFMDTYTTSTVYGSGAEIEVDTEPGASIVAEVEGASTKLEAIADSEGRATLSLDDLDPAYYRVSIQTEKDGLKGHDTARFTVKKMSFSVKPRKKLDEDFPAPCNLEIRGTKLGQGLRKKKRLELPFNSAGMSSMTVSWTGMESLYVNGSAMPVRNGVAEVPLDKAGLLFSMPASEMLAGQRAEVDVRITHKEEGRHTGTLSCGLGVVEPYESGKAYNVLGLPADHVGTGQAILIHKGTDGAWTFARHVASTKPLARAVDYFVELDHEYEPLGTSCPYKDETTGEISQVKLSMKHAKLTIRRIATGEAVDTTRIEAAQPRCPATIAATKGQLTGSVKPELIDAWITRALQ